MPTETMLRGIDAEIAKARARLDGGADPLRILEMVSVSLTNKLIHPAMQALNAADSAERAILAESIALLYFAGDR